jgi:GNAT superfamily N-acetyltransferase
MAWRLGKKEFDAGKGDANRCALRALTARDLPPGILLYDGSDAVGWCSIAPRREFVRLEASRVLAPVDAEPVWSVTCFFVRKGYRRMGLSVKLLEAAVEFARAHGARIVEGYPQEIGGSLPGAFVWTGLLSTFERAGFKEVARRSKIRPVMRRYLRGRSRNAPQP